MTRSFIAAIEKYAGDRKIPIVPFECGQREETIAEPHFAEAAKAGREGVVMIGVSQERANVFRAPAKRRRVPGRYAAGRGSAFVRFIYFYIYDADWGPSFIRVCTYAPFGIRVRLNGHQSRRRHLHPPRLSHLPP